MLLKEIINILVEEILSEAKIDIEISRFENQNNVGMAEYLKTLKEKGVLPKYIPWLVKQGMDTNLPPWKSWEQVASEMYDLVSRFEKMVQMNQIIGTEKDINQYKAISSLTNIITSAEETLLQKQKRKEGEGEIKKIYQDETYLILEPLTKEASCKYGKGTEWCISATQSKNYFDEYHNEGARFLFVINRKTNDKDAIAYHKNLSNIEIFNANDDEMNARYMNTKYPSEILKTINDYLGREHFKVVNWKADFHNAMMSGDKDWFIELIYTSNTDMFVLNMKNVVEQYELAKKEGRKVLPGLYNGLLRLILMYTTDISELYSNNLLWNKNDAKKILQFYKEITEKYNTAMAPFVLKTLGVFYLADKFGSSFGEDQKYAPIWLSAILDKTGRAKKTIEHFAKDEMGFQTFLMSMDNLIQQQDDTSIKPFRERSYKYFDNFNQEEDLDKVKSLAKVAYSIGQNVGWNIENVLDDTISDTLFSM
jgi:hypothetical protein